MSELLHYYSRLHIGLVLIAAFAFWVGRTIREGSNRRDAVLFILAVAGVMAVVSGTNYGTVCNEYDDPVYGGCVDREVLFNPAPQQRLQHGLMRFVILAVPGILGAVLPKRRRVDRESALTR